MFDENWERRESRAARDADYDSYRDYDREDAAREAKREDTEWKRW